LVGYNSTAKTKNSYVNKGSFQTKKSSWASVGGHCGDEKQNTLFLAYESGPLIVFQTDLCVHMTKTECKSFGLN